MSACSCRARRWRATAGVEVMRGPKDFDKIKQDLAAAGYKGEKVVLLARHRRSRSICAEAQVAADMLQRDRHSTSTIQALDWGTVVQRRASKEPIDKGGWNIFYHRSGRLRQHFARRRASPIRGNGTSAWFGWPTDPKMEELRDAWFDAPGRRGAEADLRRRCRSAFWQDLPYVPLGMYDQPTAFHPNLPVCPTVGRNSMD